ncbi:MAG: hypothetical protein ABSC92_14685 [Rhizomicrobium sp.]
MRRLPTAILLASSLGVFLGAADAPPPAMKTMLVRGTIEDITATTLTIKTDAGADIAAAITPKTRYAAVEARSFAQIKSTDFVGITSVPGANGHLSAEEVHIIPVVGLGEGQYPWDHHPSTGRTASSGMGSMTNGTVGAPLPAKAGSMTNGTVTTSGGAQQLTVTYHGASLVNGHCEGRAVPGQPGCTGTAIVDITPSTFIAAIVPAKPDDLKPGLAVVAGVATDDAGHTFLGSATVEKNGVKPEF